MARESTQHKLDRVRPPRVQITYDVQIGDAFERKELPFVLGVVGDFSGKPKDPLPRLKEREFVNIDRDNFNEVLKGMAPRVALRADNKLEKDGTQLSADLSFKNIEDFEPEQVVQQVDPLRKLLEVRRRLSDLKNTMYGSERLEERLQEVIANTEELETIAQKTGYTQEGRKKGSGQEGVES